MAGNWRPAQNCLYTQISAYSLLGTSHKPVSKNCYCLLVDIPTRGKVLSFHSEGIVTCELTCNKKMQKIVLKVEIVWKVKPKNATGMKEKHFSVFDCFRKHAAQHFVFFCRLSCIWNAIHFIKCEKILQDERKGRRNVFLPSSSQPLPRLHSFFSTWICAVKLGEKPLQSLAFSAGLTKSLPWHAWLPTVPSHMSLLWWNSSSLMVCCNLLSWEENLSYMSFDVKYLYQFITATSFSLITALEIT